MKLVVPSNWARDSFISKGIDPGRISVVPHGFDPGTHRFDEAARESVRRQLGLHKFTFLNVGSLFDRKGTDRLLAAFLVLLERGVDATLVVKGSDNVYNSDIRLKQLLAGFTPEQRNLILRNLKYIGQPLETAWMTRLFSAADAYVSPYIAEGFNMPVLEAAAVGLPLIVTGGGPTDDFTTDSFRKKIAAHVDTSEGKRRLRPSVEHLVELMTGMVDDQDFVRQARVAGPQFVHNGYRWDDVADQLVSVFRTLV
jgi:glycosyltransferase involved in cell wall biosynthesis